MGQPNTERQDNWRKRLQMRADFFPAADALRRRSIVEQMGEIEGPEALRVRDFLLAYPRCFYAPYICLDTIGEFGPGARWIAQYGYDDERGAMWSPTCMSTLRLAFAEASSLPVVLTWFGDGSSSYSEEDEYPETTRRVAAEIAEMRRLNIWGA